MLLPISGGFLGSPICRWRVEGVGIVLVFSSKSLGAGEQHHAVLCPTVEELVVNGEVSCPFPQTTDKNQPHQVWLRTKGEVKMMEPNRGWSGQGCFLEEGALEMGLDFNSDRSLLGSTALAPWEASCLGVHSWGTFWTHWM